MAKKVPQRMVRSVAIKVPADWKLAFVDCIFKDEIMVTTTVECHHPLKGIQCGYQKSPHSVGKMDKAGLQIVRFFK